MQILIIDNNINPPSWGSFDLCKMIQSVSDATIHVRRAPHEDLPQSPKNFDKIIVSGSKTSALDESPWVKKLIIWVQKSLELKKPYLGVCFGHQILARTLGGMSTVAKSHTPEFGWTKIQSTHSNDLLKNLPSSFYSFSAHYDEVIQLPKNCISFAKSKKCKIQAFQLENEPIFGIQFHPEKEFNDASKILKEMKMDAALVSIINDAMPINGFNSKIGEQIFKNFLQMDKKN